MGPPCGIFSAARWNFAGPVPPVRSKIEIYGLASNDAKLQRQADEGMLLARESCALMKEIVLASPILNIGLGGGGTCFSQYFQSHF